MAANRPRNCLFAGTCRAEAIESVVAMEKKIVEVTGKSSCELEAEVDKKLAQGHLTEDDISQALTILNAMDTMNGVGRKRRLNP